MTDLLVTCLCAEAMGWKVRQDNSGRWRAYELDNKTVVYGIGDNWIASVWNPLQNDAQAMSLIKRLGLHIIREGAWRTWHVCESPEGAQARHAELNRAVCECAAKIQQKQSIS